MVPIDFCEQASHIRVQQTNFTVSWRSSNEKHIGALIMDQKESRIYTMNQSEEKKRGPQRNLVDKRFNLSPINVSSPICFNRGAF
jgi:hypothetical protein